MTALRDLTGQRFGRLVVTERAASRPGSGRNMRTFWACVCDCGAQAEVWAANLSGGTTRSCGCLHDEIIGARSRTHGDTSGRWAPEYTSWSGMIQRCHNPRNPNFQDYGARGIIVCDRWRGAEGYQNFLADMGRRPSAEHTIERSDNDGPYAPGNCRWATRKEQANNKRPWGSSRRRHQEQAA